MKKNVKGFISLFAALAAIVLIIVGCCRLGTIAGTRFWVGTNSVFGWLALLCCLIAIVFAVLSFKDKDKKGPRKTGMIIAILCILPSFIPVGLGAAGSLVDDYAKGQNNVISDEMAKYDKGDKESLVYKIMNPDGELDSQSKEMVEKVQEFVNSIRAEHDKNAK